MRIILKQNSTSGITLVDTIIATAIVAVMAGGVICSLSYGFLTMGRIRENQRATQLLLETVETLRLYNWAQVNSNNFIPPTFTGVYDPQSAPGSQGITYYGTITKATAANGTSYSSNLMQVTVTLNWTSRNLSHTRTLATYIAKDGLQNYVY
jgi:type II secretory pathway pseudopilin PulG